MSQPLIQATNLHKFFGQTHIIKGVDLEIGQGEIVSITGPSGAGKTTLLQLLSSLERISTKKESPNFQIEPAPKIMVNGTDITKLKAQKLAKFRNEQIGFVFQFHQLLPEFSVEENIYLPAMIGGKFDEQTKKYGKELAEILNITDKLKQKPTTLSGGEQQRVAVARALINKPSIVFADEPSGNLDSQNAEQLHRLFQNLSRKMGQAFVIVTHNPSLAKMGNRNICMRDGKIENIEYHR